MNQGKVFIIGLLMYLANKAGTSTFRQVHFYPLKDKLLTIYGTYKGWDLQHITKECWNCQGKGCHRCHKGIYEQKYILLDRYRIANFMFHIPKQNFGCDPRGSEYYEKYYGKPVNLIEGYIRHNPKHPFKWLCQEAELWLFFIFQRSSFEYYLDWGWRAWYPRPLPLLFYRDIKNAHGFKGIARKFKEIKFPDPIRKIKLLDLRNKDIFPSADDLPF